MGRASRCSAEVRERVVRMVREHGVEHGTQWSAIRSSGECERQSETAEF